MGRLLAVVSVVLGLAFATAGCRTRGEAKPEPDAAPKAVEARIEIALAVSATRRGGPPR